MGLIYHIQIHKIGWPELSLFIACFAVTQACFATSRVPWYWVAAMGLVMGLVGVLGGMTVEFLLLKNM